MSKRILSIAMSGTDRIGISILLSLALIGAGVFADFGYAGKWIDLFFGPERIDGMPGPNVAVTDDTVSACLDTAPLPGLSGSDDASLRRLGAYQDFCGSSVSDRMMVFVAFPTDPDSADALARGVSTVLSRFAAAGVTPVVLVEPTGTDGRPVRLADVADGDFDDALVIFFGKLSALGVTERELGIWIPYPEINTPAWDRNGFSETMFPGMVSDFFFLARRTFPDIRTGLLLNARSYDIGDTDWGDPRAGGFLPYLFGMEPGEAEVLVVQGFPWLPSSGGEAGAFLDPREFLVPDATVDAALRLGVSEVWVHTGTFGEAYAGTEGRVTLSPAERERTLRGIEDVLLGIRDRTGLKTTLSLFAKDKSGTDEAVDWSYDIAPDGEEGFLRPFLRRVSESGIRIMIFDS